jgi:metal-dependent hydrolase (beta-lactamase superfamily II)
MNTEQFFDAKHLILLITGLARKFKDAPSGNFADDAFSRRFAMAYTARRLVQGGFLVLASVILALTAASLPASAADGPATQQAGAAQLPARLSNVGATRTLEILPLVDWNVANSGLRGEAGVSYLVRTDSSAILFDVGGNLESTDPPPLVHNMRQLGVKLADIDTIVISHNHTDHVGGQMFAATRSFSLEYKQADLKGKRVYVPIPMTYPGIKPVVVRAPMVIAPGVTTTGPIPTKIHMGPVNEQALAVRVEGKGIVLIVGCGHQGLSRLLDRSAELFDEPIYGVIGGLHYPVPRGRWFKDGVDVQRWATYGLESGPTPQDVQREIELLAGRGPQWVSLSPHDSSDEMIDAFRAKFGTRFHDLRVGEPQVIAKLKP